MLSVLSPVVAIISFPKLIFPYFQPSSHSIWCLDIRGKSNAFRNWFHLSGDTVCFVIYHTTILENVVFTEGYVGILVGNKRPCNLKK